MKAPDFLIIGGGLIGLSIAWQLARRGVSVTVLDTGKPGMASRAAAGMLAPLAEADTANEPFVAIAVKSLLRYPQFLQMLAEDSGTIVPISGTGTYRLAMRGADAEEIRASFMSQKKYGLPLEWLDSDSVRRIEPQLPPAADAAIYSPSERQISPRPLHAALANACRNRGASIVNDTVTGFNTDGTTVKEVQTSESRISCGHTVLAAGAWTLSLAKMLDFQCPVKPIKGQILALGPRLPLPFTHTVYMPGGYIVPRDDGRIIVGASQEDVGFDTATTAAGVARLLELAMSAHAPLCDWPIDEIWTGLRPVSPDGCPLLGPAPRWTNVSLATGHGRNGVLLTPITADLAASNLLDGAPIPAAFGAARFGAMICDPQP